MGKDASKVFLASAFALFAGFIGSLFSLKVLNVNQIGTVASFNNLVAIFSGITISGINISFIRYVSLYLKKDNNVAAWLTKRIFFIEIVISLFFFITLIVFASFFSTYIFHKPELAPFIRLSGITIIQSIIFSFFITFFQTYQKFTLYSVLSISQASLTTIGIIIFSYLKILSAEKLIYIGIAVYVIFIIIGYFYYLKYRVHAEQNGVLPKSLIKDIIHYTKWIIIQSLGIRLLTKADIFILTTMVTLGQVALYSFANTIYITYRIIPNTISMVLFPKLSSLQKPREFIEASKKIFKYSTLISLFIIPTFFIIKPLSLLFFGQKFNESLPLIYILLAAFVIISAFNPAGNILLAMEKQKFVGIATALILPVSIGLYLILIPRYNILGATWATAISHSLYNVALAVKVLIELKKVSKTLVISP